MPTPEPLPGSSSSPTAHFLIGRDSRGRWVAQDQQGLCGGLFVNQAEAIRFAMREIGRRPQAVVLVPGVIELDMTRTRLCAGQHPRHASERRAA